MQPDLVKEFVAEFHREVNRRNAALELDDAQHRSELERVDRQIRAIVDAIKDGLRTSAMKDELLALEARKEELAAVCARKPAATPRLHPNLAEIYRQKVARLHEELNREDVRAEAAEVIRSLISKVRLVPENGRLEIELAGDLAGILALTAGSRKPVTGTRDGLQLTLVAGEGFEPMTLMV
jgi:hypothetical protein